jgi:hypothetical protein
MARASGIATALLTYFQERPDKVITVDVLMKHFNVTREQVSGNVYNLRKREVGKDIEQLAHGMWRYVTKKEKVAEEIRPAPGMPKFDGTITVEIIKVSEDGKHRVGMDNEGNVYKITLLA